MQSNSSVHGIANGHWEHIESPSLASRLFQAAHERLNKLLASNGEPSTASRANESSDVDHPIAAE